MSTRELERVEVMGRVAKGGTQVARRSPDAAAQLPAGEAGVATLSGGWRQRAEAWQCGPSVEAA